MRRHGEHFLKKYHTVRSGIKEFKKISILIDESIYILNLKKLKSFKTSILVFIKHSKLHDQTVIYFSESAL